MGTENIKTKVDIYYEGQEKPFASAEDFQILKNFFYITDNSKNETDISEVKVNGSTFEIVNIEISILKETQDGHLKFGIDTALSGEPMPYNFRVSVFIRKNH